MGLADRDYTRRPPTGGGSAAWAGRPRMLSVTAWLIIINIAVFVLGSVLLGNLYARISLGQGVLPGVPTDALSRAVELRTPGAIQPDPRLRNTHAVPLVDPQTGQQIGIRRYGNWPAVEAFGHFSTGKVFTELQIWRFITFQFLHGGFFHLALNMLGLYFFAPIVENWLGSRRFLAFYLLCGAAGALLYLVLNLIGYFTGPLPGVLFSDVYTPLVGASAGVFGILLASAFIAPNETVYVLFAIPARLQTVVYLFIGLALFNLLTGGNNAGGDAAHVGGAIAGYYFIRRPRILQEIVETIRPGGGRRGPDRAVRGGARPGRPAPGRPTPPPPPRSADERVREDAELDRILAKIREEGTASLTERERTILRRATDALRDGG